MRHPHPGTLQRYFLEKVGNAYQGAIFRFSSGLDAAANRIVEGPDSAIYIGGIGTGEWGGWSWAGSSAKLSADKKKLTLTISGIQLKDVIYIKLSNVMSATGNVASWSTETWYTLNAFGPGSPSTQVGLSTAVDHKQPKVDVRALAGGKVSFRVASAGLPSTHCESFKV